MKVGKKKSRDLLRHVGREYTRIGLDEWTEMQSEVNRSQRRCNTTTSLKTDRLVLRIPEDISNWAYNN